MTKKIRLLQGIVTNTGSRDPGTVVDMLAADADRMVDRGYAEFVEGAVKGPSETAARNLTPNRR